MDYIYAILHDIKKKYEPHSVTTGLNAAHRLIEDDISALTGFSFKEDFL